MFASHKLTNSPKLPLACASGYLRQDYLIQLYLKVCTVCTSIIPGLYFVFKGTIKSCQNFLIKHNKEQLVKMLAQCKTPGW